MKATFSPTLQGNIPTPAAKARGWFAPLNPPMKEWQGRRVWVVGASSGIGQATAAALLRQGARVVVSARNTQALDTFVNSY